MLASSTMIFNRDAVSYQLAGLSSGDIDDRVWRYNNVFIDDRLQ